MCRQCQEGWVPTATLHMHTFVLSCSFSRTDVLLVVLVPSYWCSNLDSMGSQCGAKDRVTEDTYRRAPFMKVTFTIFEVPLPPFHVASELEKTVRMGITLSRLQMRLGRRGNSFNIRGRQLCEDEAGVRLQ